MKFPRIWNVRHLALALALAGSLPAPAQSLNPLDQALKDAAAFDYGKGNDGALNAAEQIIVASAKDESLRPAVEQRVLALLDAPRATRTAREFACRQLMFVGSAAAVPKLEPLLRDPQLSYLARNALGRIEAPAAAEALRRALGNTSGELQVGVIHALGNRRHAPAVADLARLLAASDPAVARAAAAALGDVAGDQATRALESARPAAPTELRGPLDHALLACGDAALAAGEKERAAELFEKLYTPDRPLSIRAAALGGLVRAKGAAARGPIIAALKGDDRRLAVVAAGFVREVKDGELAKALVEALPTLPPTAQEPVLRALAEQAAGAGDSAADRAERARVSAALLAAAGSETVRVRLAALEGLGTVGDATAVGPLAAAAAKGGEDQRVAREALLRLPGEAANGAILESAADPKGDPKARAEMLRAAGGRRMIDATAAMFRLTNDADSGVRAEAYNALGMLLGEGNLSELLRRLAEPKEEGDRSAAEGAASAVCRRSADPRRPAGVVLAALASAAPGAKPSLLRVLKSAPSAEALSAVRSAVGDPAPAVAEAALRTLADWPDPAAADDLLALAKSRPDAKEQVLALRGYIRLAGLSPQPLPMYARAMELAHRPDEKKMVLGGLNALDSAEALEFARQSLKEPALQSEAAQAVLQVAARLKDRAPAKAREALNEVTSTVKDQRLRKQAEEALAKMEKK